MKPLNWTCPHCERAVTITDDRLSINSHTLDIENAEGRRTLVSQYRVCPNQDCKKFTLYATLYESTWNARDGERFGSQLHHWSLIPDSRAQNFPTYIPQVILEDYREACIIKDLSPKASATLSRRCLQGMIRDFWKVKSGRLVDEIAAIQSQVDPLTWDAIEAVRKIGNIGAHMEKDIDVIVEVDPNEAILLIELIETLVREWYINREERRARMGHLVAAAATKKAPGP
jgi:hypothetical protein